MKISPEKSLVSPNNKMDPLTPSKHGQFESSISGGSPVTAVRQRARTVGSVGGESIKRELARRRQLTRLREETQEVEQEPSPRMTIFNKTAVKSASPVSSVRSSSRQQIFQV